MLGALFIATAVPQIAVASTNLWTGGDGSLTTSGNWSPATTPSTGDIAEWNAGSYNSSNSKDN
jgi:hypothetical protein